MDNTERVTWLLAIRAHRAQRRLELQDDLNTGFFPKDRKQLRLYLAQQAYDLDDPVYQAMVTALAIGA